MGSQGADPEGLADRISTLYVKSHGFGGGDFVPAGCYRDPEILNPAVVREELELEVGDDEPLINFTLTRAPKIFLAIICRNWPADQTRRFMQHFMQSEFVDEKLPVSLDFCHADPAFGLKGWKLGLKRNFCTAQWDHLAPVFSEKNFIFRLEQNQPLPFLKPDAGVQKAPQGASSVVHQVKVHPDHLEDPPLDVSLMKDPPSAGLILTI